MQITNEVIEFGQIICKEYGDIQFCSESIIGKGYEGTVWKLSNEYCLKIIPYKKIVNFPEVIKTCPNLCVPIETYISPSGKYSGIIQRFLNSDSLEKYVDERIRLSEKETALIIYGALNGLANLHENGYVHRDFHPGNIMLNTKDDTCTAVIIDLDETQKITANTIPCFRFNGYHAPEIVFYNELYDAKSEIFALGIIMWELLFGNCVFGGYDFFGRVIRDSWMDYAKSPGEYNKRVHEALKTLIDSLNQTRLLSTECSCLLRSMLAIRKEDRITASEALEHNYFKKYFANE